MNEQFSRPERSVARNEGRRIREQVHAAGGCRFCINRDRTFEGLGQRYVCGLQRPLKFPDCAGRAVGFDFDEAAFRGNDTQVQPNG